MAWRGVAWRGVAWPGLAWPGLAWPGLAWPGLAWPGLAWHGVAWRGVAWRGITWRDAALIYRKMRCYVVMSDRLLSLVIVACHMRVNGVCYVMLYIAVCGSEYACK